MQRKMRLNFFIGIQKQFTFIPLHAKPIGSKAYIELNELVNVYWESTAKFSTKVRRYRDTLMLHQML